MDPIRDGADQGVIRDMGLLAVESIERRKRLVGLGPDDLARILSLRELVREHAVEYAAAFFDSLAGIEEAKGLLQNRELLERARRLKLEHIATMADGDYGVAYAEERVKLGRLYSQAGVLPRVFLGAFQTMLRSMGMTVMKHSERSPIEGFENFMSLQKVAFYDIGIIMDVPVFERERVIRHQQEAIQELSTPVLQVRDRLLLLPIVGVIDTHRARLITENLLRSIRANRAKVVVMDVTGVLTIDSMVANHLMQTISAARLMGAFVIVTGLSSEVAQSLVSLGIELSKLNTVGDLQGGVEEAERILGYRVLQPTAQSAFQSTVRSAAATAEPPSGNGGVVE